MICPVNAQGFYGDQWSLVTAIVLGFFFGFSLERAGFGNARKLAAQFYGYDMTVFKVMFTAVLVAMVGLYAFVSFGLMDLEMLWINPTFMWGQLVGGFLIGVGFAVSGLCPGTSVVSAASGRIDGLMTVLGAFFGTFLFSMMMDWVPGLGAFINSGFQGRSLLHELIGIPAPWLALGVVLMALGAFIGAEALEKKFGKNFEPVPLTPTGGEKVKFYLVGALALVALVSGLAGQPELVLPPAPQAAPYEPLELAEAMIRGDADLMVLDVRAETDRETGGIPGARPAKLDPTTEGLLGFAAPGSTVLLLGDGNAPALPDSWRGDLDYRYLRGGFIAWQGEVLTPREMNGGSLAEREATRRQNQIAAYFSGTEAKVESSAPPPPAPTGGGRKKKKAAGGC